MHLDAGTQKKPAGNSCQRALARYMFRRGRPLSVKKENRKRLSRIPRTMQINEEQHQRILDSYASPRAFKTLCSGGLIMNHLLPICTQDFDDTTIFTISESGFAPLQGSARFRFSNIFVGFQRVMQHNKNALLEKQRLDTYAGTVVDQPDFVNLKLSMASSATKDGPRLCGFYSFCTIETAEETFMHSIIHACRRSRWSQSTARCRSISPLHGHF
jgi:hypothetical protein